MNQVINHTEQQIEVINPMAVMGTVKSIVPRSFEKTFSGLTTEQISYSFKICLDGLTREQIQVGMAQVRDNGFCPDPAMFRKWCLGVKGFSTDVDPIHASYRKKSAALANIESWVSDSTTQITNAEREAYNRCYGMFNDLQFNYSAKQKFHTYEAFKDFYEEVVKEFVSNGICQCIWEKPLEIESKVKYQAKPKDYLSEMPDDFKEKLDHAKNLMNQKISEGMTAQEAARFLINQGFKNGKENSEKSDI